MTDDTWARVAKLTLQERNDILADLFYCLDAGRLIDFSNGWEKTRKGNFRSTRGEPVTIPIWFSLHAAGYDVGVTL